RRLYFNPRLIADHEIQVTNGVLSGDATFMVRLENRQPSFVIVRAADTSDNQNLNDLFDDVNRALVAAGLEGRGRAGRLQPVTQSPNAPLTHGGEFGLPPGGGLFPPAVERIPGGLAGAGPRPVEPRVP